MEVARHRVNLTAMWETWLTLTLRPLQDDPQAGVSGHRRSRGKAHGASPEELSVGLEVGGPGMQYPPQPGTGLSETSVEESFRTWGNM